MTKKKVTKKKSTPKKKIARIVTKAAKVGSAVTKAVKEFTASLGPKKVDGAKAEAQMNTLADLLEDVATAKAKADEKAADAKTAKGTYESKVNLFLERVRTFTHPKALPLFDAADEDRALLAMTDGQ